MRISDMNFDMSSTGEIQSEKSYRASRLWIYTNFPATNHALT